uniref:Glia maturation factor gamma n=1 Tax=Sus scrofa TaxID=9823 RepID=A0A4X1SWK1_PIG
MKERGFQKEEPASAKAWWRDHLQSHKQAGVDGEEWTKHNTERQDPRGHEEGWWQSDSLVVCEVDPELKEKLRKFRFRKETDNAAIIKYFSGGTKNGVARETAKVWGVGEEGEGQAVGSGVMMQEQTEGPFGFQSYSQAQNLYV